MNQMQNKTPEERRSIAAKGHATRRARLDAVATERHAAEVYAGGLREKLEPLLRRSLAQLRKWAEWYGKADHAARGQLPLPPAGNVELADDISAALGPNAQVVRRGAAGGASYLDTLSPHLTRPTNSGGATL